MYDTKVNKTIKTIKINLKLFAYSKGLASKVIKK